MQITPIETGGPRPVGIGFPTEELFGVNVDRLERSIVGRVLTELECGFI